jgi:hypothetical protein
MLTCRYAKKKKKIMWSFKGLKINKKGKTNFVMSHNTHTHTHTKRDRERERTWQNPDTPAIDSKLKALARKASNGIGSLCSSGGGPGTVGIARTPKS